MADDPESKTPIALSPETFARHSAAVEYVEGLTRTRAPRPGKERSPGLAPGAWALLLSGNSITAASGTTLGTGSVNLCDRAGTDSGQTITVYNAGPAVTASGDRIVRLTWTVGDWSVSCAGSS